MRRSRTSLMRFGCSERGSFSIEAVLLLPLMAWAILSAFSYFDGLRQTNMNIKAAHTISDMLSRETDAIDEAYILGMQKVLDFLTGQRFDTALRVSVFSYDSVSDSFSLQWSQATSPMPALTGTEQADVEARLPMTAGGDTIITVETWVDYRTLFTYALDDTVLYEFAATRARYVPQLLYSSGD